MRCLRCKIMRVMFFRTSMYRMSKTGAGIGNGHP